MTTHTERELLKDASYFNLKSTISLIERELILECMDFTSNNQSLTATLLGISRGKLRYKLKSYQGHLEQVSKQLDKERAKDVSKKFKELISQGLTIDDVKQSL